MNKKVKTIAGLACAYSAGHFVGSITRSAAVTHKMREMQPLVAKIIADIIDKARRENMSAEELGVYCNQELDFMRIVIRNGA